MPHCFLLEMAEFRMRLCIEGEETTDVDVTFRCERRAGIKPESWLSYHERKVFIPLVLTQVIGNHKFVFSSFSIGLFQSDSILSVPERATVSYEIAGRERSGEIRAHVECVTCFAHIPGAHVESITPRVDPVEYRTVRAVAFFGLASLRDDKLRIST